MRLEELTREQLLDEARSLRARVAELERAREEHQRTADALRESEERYRRIVEIASEGLWTVDAGWQTTFVNTRMAQMLGYEPAEMLGRHVFDFIDEQARPAARQQMGRREQGFRDEHVLLFRRKDGGELWAQVSATPVLSAGGFAGALAMVMDVTQRRRDELRLREYAERLQALSRRLVQVQEEERRHLARELHDEIGQVLTAVTINLHGLKDPCGPAAAAALEESIAVVDRAIRQVRDLSLDLRPSLLDDLGLAAALRWYAERQGQRTGLEVRFAANWSGADHPPEIKNACFRVAQEALTNVARHARAGHVWIELQESEEGLELEVRDDGAGFDPAAARRRAARGGTFGLLGMQERVELLGGRLAIESAPGEGTTVRVRFPLGGADQG